MNVFYTMFYFSNNKYIATFVSAFGQGFVFWVENIGQNHVPYNKIIKLKKTTEQSSHTNLSVMKLYIEEFYKLKYCSTVVYMVPRA